MSLQRVSIFELEEGNEYRAIKPDGTPARLYTLKNGKLFNRDGGGAGGEYVGCEWVPINAGYTFELVSKAATPPVTILTMKEGVVYKARGWAEGIARVGDKLFFTDRYGTPYKEMDKTNIDLSLRFEPSGRAREREVISPGDQVKAYWDEELMTRKQRQLEPALI